MIQDRKNEKGGLELGLCGDVCVYCVSYAEVFSAGAKRKDMEDDDDEIHDDVKDAERHNRPGRKALEDWRVRGWAIDDAF